MADLVDNHFALVLVFYDQYKRTKLLAADLAKIAKKYASKSAQLISDLEKKYDIPIPKQCNAADLTRICQLYGVPDSYRTLLPNQFMEINSVPYDPVYDVRSPLFDAEKVLTTRRIISACSTREMCDNLSKCKPFLASFEGKIFTHESKAAERLKEKGPKPEKSVHILSRVAIDSCAKVNFTDESGNESLHDSPFVLAHTFLLERSRVRVIMRRRGG